MKALAAVFLFLVLLSQEKISVYPNPAVDYVHISGKFSKYILHDVLGQKIKSGAEKTIDLRGLAAGVYILEVDKKALKIIKK